MSSSPGCRVPQPAKEPRTTVDWRNIMNADELKKLTTESLDHLSAALAEGHSDRLSALLKTMAQFHRYSFHNVCLIARQRPDATRVAGFHAWRKLGRFVRKGEKGIAILAPIVVAAARGARTGGGTAKQDVYTRITARIVTALEHGVRPWVRPWDA